MVKEITINPNTTLTAEFTIDSGFLFGFYTVEGIIYEANGSPFSISISKNVCEPDEWNGNQVPGKFNIKVDCATPQATIKEETPLTYLKKPAVSKTVSGTMFYPDNLFDSVDFSATPFSVGATDGLYTGLYRVRNTTKAKYDLGDDFSVIIPYVTRSEFEVTCDGDLKDILCCISDVYSEYSSNRGNSKAVNAKSKLDAIGPDLMMAVIKDLSGKDCAKEVKKIKDLLNCDCGCGSKTYLAPAGISAGGNIGIVGLGGSSVSFTTSGNTTNYVVRSKEVSVNKADPTDLNFSITKSANDLSSVFALAFDYQKLSETILNTIGANEDLLDLLNQIINNNAQNVIDGLDGKCVINDLNKADYSLSEPASSLKTISKIVIDGTDIPAPTGLSTTNPVAVKNWLDGLNKGTFNVNLNQGNGKITITTLASTYMISTLSFVTAGQTVVRSFDRITKSLAEILQAIINYVCDIDTQDVDLSAQITLTKRDAQGNITTQTFASGSSLQAYLVALNAQFAVYANSPVKGDKGEDGEDGVSQQVFVQPGVPTGGTYRNGDMWIVQ